MNGTANTNSMGYIVQSRNGMLIVIDGGLADDAEILLDYINKYGNGKVDYWYVTHGHKDHIGALLKILDEHDIFIENICYNFNPLEWYEAYDKRGYETERKFLLGLDNPKIKNKIVCAEGQVIQMDNISCEILRVANPEVIHSDNGNDSSMVFKMTALDVEKSMLFLGDAYVYTELELMENPEKLKANAVQMAHHGQNGIGKETYMAIEPEICFFNTPEWLYNNDNGGGYNSGKWQSIEVRKWINELGAKSYLAFEGDVTLHFAKDGYHIIED